MMLRWAFAVATALVLGLGFGVLSGNAVLAVASGALVFLGAACVLWERRPPRPARGGRRTRGSAADSGYPAAWGGTSEGGPSSEGHSGFGGDGGADDR